MVSLFVKVLFPFCLVLSAAQAEPQQQIRYVWYLSHETSDVSNILIEYAYSGQEGTRSEFSLGYANKQGQIVRRGQIFRARREEAYMSSETSLEYRPNRHLDETMIEHDGKNLFLGEVIDIFADPNNPSKASAQIRYSVRGGVEEQLSGTFGDMKVDATLIQVKRRLDPGNRSAEIFKFKSEENLGLSFRKDGSRAGNVLFVIKARELPYSGDKKTAYEAKIVVGWLTSEGIEIEDVYPGIQIGTMVYLTRERVPLSVAKPLATLDTYDGALKVGDREVKLEEVVREPEEPSLRSIHAYERTFEKYYVEQVPITPDKDIKLVAVTIPANADIQSECNHELQGELPLPEKQRQPPPIPAAAVRAAAAASSMSEAL